MSEYRATIEGYADWVVEIKAKQRVKMFPATAIWHHCDSKGSIALTGESVACYETEEQAKQKIKEFEGNA